MMTNPVTTKSPAEQVVKDILRATPKLQPDFALWFFRPAGDNGLRLVRTPRR